MKECDWEQLEAHALGRPQEAPDDVREHLATCDACRTELALLVRERALLAGIAPPEDRPLPAFSVVLAATARSRAAQKARGRWRTGAFAGMAAAAAGVALLFSMRDALVVARDPADRPAATAGSTAALDPGLVTVADESVVDAKGATTDEGTSAVCREKKQPRATESGNCMQIESANVTRGSLASIGYDVCE